MVDKRKVTLNELADVLGYAYPSVGIQDFLDPREAMAIWKEREPGEVLSSDESYEIGKDVEFGKSYIGISVFFSTKLDMCDFTSPFRDEMGMTEAVTKMDMRTVGRDIQVTRIMLGPRYDSL